MPAVVYTFSAAGESAVLGAFRSISEEARRNATEVRQSTGRQRTAQDETARKVRSQGRTQQQEQRAQLQAQRRANQEQLREQQRAARAQQRVQARAERERVAAQRRTNRETNREIFRENARQVRAQRAADRAAQRQRGRRAEAITGFGTRAIAAIGAGTIGIVGLAARQGIQLQDRATRLAIKGSSATNRIDPTALRKEAQDVARNVRGAKAEGVVAAQEQFVGKTGRLDLARQFGETFAKISVATGTEMADIGSAAADMMEKFDIKSVDDMANALSLLSIQGKRGAFELTDAASQFPKMAAAAQRFGLKGVEGLATLGGLSQIARRATPSGEEAATSVENLFKALVMESDKLQQKYGVKVFEDKGKTRSRDVRDIIVETISQAKGNQKALQDIFDVRGIRAVSPLISLFNETRQAAIKGGATEEAATAAAVARLRKEIDDAANVQNARTEIEKDLATAQQQASANITAAWESFVAQISEATPELTQQLIKAASFIAETDFSAVVTGFRAVAEAAGLLAEGLYATGIIKRKAKTPGELMKEGEKELAALAPQRAELTRRARLAAGDPATNKAALAKEFQELSTKEEAARGKVQKATEAIWQEPSKVQRNVTEAQFVQQLGMPEFMAKGIAGIIKEQPAAAGLFTAATNFDPAANLLTYMMGGEPQGITSTFAPKQTELITQFAETQAAQQAGVPPTINTDQANAQLQALSDALGTAVAAARGFATRPATAFHE